MSRYSSAALSDVGMKRTNNEDAYALRPDLGLYVVADGMGGHSCGEVASKIAVSQIVEFLENSRLDEESTWPYAYDDSLSFQGNKLKTAVSAANEKIQEYAGQHAESRGMGTTVVAAMVHDDRLIMSHVGDSRAYLFRGGALSALTSDHSWVNEQVKMGFLSQSEAQHHPFRNVITKALGTKGEALADVSETPLMAGDLVLLCTDGLNTMVSDEKIAKLLSEARDLEKACKALVEAANEGGGEDNVTVLLLRRDE